MVRKLKLTALLLLLCIPTIQASEDDCGGLVRKLLLSQKETYVHERTILRETEKLQSPSDLVAFFKEYTKIGSSNEEYLKGMADFLFPEIARDGKTSIESFVRKMLQSFKHERDSKTFFELVSFARGEHSHANYMLRNMVSDLSNEDFATFYKAGKNALQNEDFLLALEKAIQDVKAFDPIYGKRVHVEKSMEAILDIFIEFNDPVLTGMFVSKFQKMDNLTRQYVLDQISTFKREGESYQIIFKFARENEEDLTANQKGLVSFLSKDLDELKMTAYFNYTSNGNSARPHLEYNEETIEMAVRFLDRIQGKTQRMGFEDVFPQEFLMDAPFRHSEIDRVLGKSLSEGDEVSDEMKEHFLARYSNLEIDLEIRNAKGLGNVPVDFRFTLYELLENTDTRPRLYHEIFRLDQEVGLDKYPELKAAFKKHIETQKPDLNNIFIFEETPPEFLEMIRNL